MVGYVTLICSEINLNGGYLIEDSPNAKRYDHLPAIKIARLAVCAKHRGQQIGQTLLDVALSLVIDNIAPYVGCRFLITDAKQESVPFYLKQGFILVDSEQNRESDTPSMYFDLARA